MKRNLYITTEQRKHANRILNETAAKYGATPNDIIKPSKRVALANMKREFWARLMYEVDLSVTWAARFAKKDHTTLIHGMRRMGQEYYGLPYVSSLEEIGELWKAHNLAWRDAA